MRSREWSVWSTTARLVVTDDRAVREAGALVDELLTDVSRACSRFDPMSELMMLRPGRTRVSPMLARLLAAALRVAERTEGAVDPTIGGSLVALGYDRDIGALSGDSREVTVVPAPGWHHLRLDGDELTLPAGVLLDLGATAKALAADLAAARVAEQLGTGVLLELGGDIATAGPAPGGWQVLVQDLPGDPAQQVTLASGAALATSSTVRRTWAGGTRHHVVDPTTGRSSRAPWRTVSVVASSCLDANAVATATLAMGERGVGWLAATGLPTRLVGRERLPVTMGGWPREAVAA